MTTQACHDDEELGALAPLPPGDARLAHLVQCPSCSARLAEYRAFLGGEAAPGARLAVAEERLAGALAAEMGSPRPAEPGRAAAGRKGGWLAALLAPALRPAWGLAVVVLLAGGAWLALGRAPSQPVLRGPGEKRTVIRTLAPIRSEDALTLVWKPVGETEHYEVRFFATDLTDLTRLDTGKEYRLTLRRADLPRELPAGQKVLWQVVALRGHDELASSKTQAVVLP